jgi:cysteinyl-tRNA synthetase
MGLRLYNTASRIVEDFTPLSLGVVTMYNCGPTVYNYQHIGNMRSYVFADVLRRTIEANGLKVRQVINITDVGHLVSDSDEGEDKMVVGATREGKSVEEIIALYSDAFYKDLDALHIKKAEKYPRATAYIAEQKAFIEKLSEQGYAYVTSDGIYFDTSKFPRYADFAKLDSEGMQAGLRVAMGEKKHATDFALWKFSPQDGAQREQEWDSPLAPERKGFPGWHIECSAIILKELGETIDIHTGGVDHIPVHHTNEIAQSESLNNKPLARFWMHNAHMMVDNTKMSKSLGNTYLLGDLHERGIPPLAYRYWLLTAHYRTQVNFTWDALAGAQSAYNRLTNYVIDHKKDGGVPIEKYVNEFMSEINEDLNTANAIALVWKLTKDSEHSEGDKYATLLKFNEVLGLGLEVLALSRAAEVILPANIAELVHARQRARDEKNWAESDRLRDELLALGFEAKDTSDGQKIVSR